MTGNRNEPQILEPRMHPFVLANLQDEDIVHEMDEIATDTAIDDNMDARDFAPLELTQESESNTMEYQTAIENTPKQLNPPDGS